MKNRKMVLSIITLSVLLAGCASSTKEAATNTKAAQRQMMNEHTENTKVLIAYFSRIGNIDATHEVDVTTSASVVTQDEDILGNLEYMAKLIRNVTGGNIHFIQTVNKYPSEYDDGNKNALDLQANQENKENARPTLATHIDSIDTYDIIFLGFPNWYGDMPMAVYSFLEEYDLSNKQIYLFNSSGGGGARDSYAKVAALQPNAMVEEHILSVSHSQVSQLTNASIQDWLDDISYQP